MRLTCAGQFPRHGRNAGCTNGSAVDPQAQSFRAGGVKLSGWHFLLLSEWA